MKRFLPLILGLLAGVALLWLLSKSCNRKPEALTSASPISEKDEVVVQAEKELAEARASLDPNTEKKLAALDNTQFETGSIAEKLYDYLASGHKTFSKEVFLFKNTPSADRKVILSKPLIAETVQLSTILKTFTNLQIEIDGHTDNDGDPLENNYLSQRRADAIRDALIANGIKPERIIARGFGSEFPVAPNDIPEGKLANRRIELILSGR